MISHSVGNDLSPPPPHTHMPYTLGSRKGDGSQCWWPVLNKTEWLLKCGTELGLASSLASTFCSPPGPPTPPSLRHTVSHVVPQTLLLSFLRAQRCAVAYRGVSTDWSPHVTLCSYLWKIRGQGDRWSWIWRFVLSAPPSSARLLNPSLQDWFRAESEVSQMFAWGTAVLFLGDSWAFYNPLWIMHEGGEEWEGVGKGKMLEEGQAKLPRTRTQPWTWFSVLGWDNQNGREGLFLRPVLGTP